MYGVVLAAMLTTGGAVPEWGRGCWGCHGCWGGCRGCMGGCMGCMGGCMGCMGGGMGCMGGCMGCMGGGMGCMGGGGCFGSSAGYMGGASCYGCFGGGETTSAGSAFGCWGAGAAFSLAQPSWSTPQVREASAPPAPARVIVQVPADARLYVDGQLDAQTAAERTILTPDLRADRDYVYNVKAEAVRDGKVVSSTKRVPLRAGRVVQVDFSDLTSSATASR